MTIISYTTTGCNLCTKEIETVMFNERLKNTSSVKLNLSQSMMTKMMNEGNHKGIFHTDFPEICDSCMNEIIPAYQKFKMTIHAVAEKRRREIIENQGEEPRKNDT